MDANGYRNEALKENTPLGIPQMDTENDGLEKVVPFNYGYLGLFMSIFRGVSPLKYIYIVTIWNIYIYRYYHISEIGEGEGTGSIGFIWSIPPPEYT